MLRSMAKTCFAYAYGGADAVRRLFPPAAQKRTPIPFIVCYHRVVEKFEYSSRYSIPSMLISTAMFERHVDWLAKRYSLISLDEVGAHLESPRQYRRPPAAITFDDGYGDVYHNALPILQRKGIPAGVFVVTGLVGTCSPQLFDRLYFAFSRIRSDGMSIAESVKAVSRHLDIDARALDTSRGSDNDPFRMMRILLKGVSFEQLERITAALEGDNHDRELMEETKPLTWDMLSSMTRCGVTIGSHTKSHAFLTAEPAAGILSEVQESRQMLEARLGQPVRHFAYPDGGFNAAVVEAVNRAGYRYGYGICRTRDRQFPLLTIPRRVLWERSCIDALGRFSSAVMTCQAASVFQSKSRCTHDHISAREATA